uniref:Uncharacterized protein n=1 Tax=Oryza sativa subsp. japonica TaxID=39947 RepID=Q337Q8_ORYSJ|nr:hypothetical protein LOC_Os10g31100 [Oryza sativa Japonica Group]
MAKEQPANLGKFMTTFMELIRLMIQQLNQQQQGNDAQAANNDTMNTGLRVEHPNRLSWGKDFDRRG